MAGIRKKGDAYYCTFRFQGRRYYFTVGDVPEAQALAKGAEGRGRLHGRRASRRESTRYFGCDEPRGIPHGGPRLQGRQVSAQSVKQIPPRRLRGS